MTEYSSCQPECVQKVNFGSEEKSSVHALVALRYNLLQCTLHWKWAHNDLYCLFVSGYVVEDLLAYLQFFFLLQAQFCRLII